MRYPATERSGEPGDAPEIDGLAYLKNTDGLVLIRCESTDC